MTTNVLIVGGGIGGAALALFLDRIGLPTQIYEAYPFDADVGGGLNIGSNGMNVLATLGLADELIDRGTRVPVTYFVDGKGRPLGSFPYGVESRYGQPAVSVRRATLHNVLQRALTDRGIGVHDRKRLVRVEETSDAVVAHFEDGSSAAGDVLIGADGARSVVRKHVNPVGPDATYIGMVGIGGFTPMDAITGVRPEAIEALTYTMGTNFFGYGGGDRGTMMWWSNLWRTQEYTSSQLRDLDENAIKRELLDLYGDFHQPIPQLINNSTHTIRQNVYDLLTLPSWHTGRVLLIGDAAHAVSPNSGQGASQALEDAMYLAKLVRDGNDLVDSFDDFEQGRRPRVEEIVAEGRRRGGDKKTASAVKVAVRNVIAKRIFAANAKKLAGRPDPWLAYKIPW
jgi:2-polyprenyl-6-methoxyphenol hydroxylase-like FAD-dependent oxidoreductase